MRRCQTHKVYCPHDSRRKAASSVTRFWNHCMIPEARRFTKPSYAMRPPLLLLHPSIHTSKEISYVRSTLYIIPLPLFGPLCVLHHERSNKTEGITLHGSDGYVHANAVCVSHNRDEIPFLSLRPLPFSVFRQSLLFIPSVPFILTKKHTQDISIEMSSWLTYPFHSAPPFSSSSFRFLFPF